VDGHRKPVYSEVLIPRGLIGRLGVILGCRALLLLHDEQGHPLFVTTSRGDQHLTTGVPAFLTRYEQHADHSQVARMIVDREGMATEFLASLRAEGRSVVTILQTNQYRDLSSFSNVGTFVPLSRDAHGQIIREVAPARIVLSREDHPDAPLCATRWRSFVTCAGSFRLSLIQRRQRFHSVGTETCPLMNGPGGVEDGRPLPLRPKKRHRNSSPL
jgi:hypothetical protein